MVFALGLAACGGSETSSSDGGTTADAARTFQCRNDACDPTSQFCILSFAGGNTDNQACGTLPAACHDCTCAQAAAGEAWMHTAGGDNCTANATLSCAQDGDEITVSCTGN
jgi:hypothetical protein